MSMIFSSYLAAVVNTLNERHLRKVDWLARICERACVGRFHVMPIRLSANTIDPQMFAGLPATNRMLKCNFKTTFHD